MSLLVSFVMWAFIFPQHKALAEETGDGSDVHADLSWASYAARPELARPSSAARARPTELRRPSSARPSSAQTLPPRFPNPPASLPEPSRLASLLRRVSSSA